MTRSGEVRGDGIVRMSVGGEGEEWSGEEERVGRMGTGTW